MKQMKFLVAVLAIAFVVVGSSFTSKKVVSEKSYGILSRTLVTSGDHSGMYHYILAETNTGECSSGAVDEKCKVRLELSYTGTSIIQNGSQYDIFVDETVNGVVTDFPEGTTLVKFEQF